MARSKKPKRTSKPRRPRASRALEVTTPSAPPRTIAELGPPPTDPLAAEAWAHSLLIASLADVAADVTLSPRERRKEMRVIAAAAAKAMPRKRLFEAEQLVREFKEQLRTKAAEKRGAKLEPRPTKQAVGVPAS
jgi:hypothetical protein